MQDFSGKTAFVTGGASGIGFALAKGFLEVGMNVMLADIEEQALDRALKSLASYDNRLGGIVLDVALRDAYEKVAEATFAKFGKVHVVCNNAGVSRVGAVEQVMPSDWDWVLGVNLKGAIAGTQLFLPHIKAHGEGGHIVNTASMARGWWDRRSTARTLPANSPSSEFPRCWPRNSRAPTSGSACCVRRSCAPACR